MRALLQGGGAESLVSIPDQFTHLLSGFPAWPLFIVLLVVSLLLIFAGRSVVKLLAFLVVGLIGASLGGSLGAQYLTSLGSLGGALGFLIGFFAGGLLGLLLIHVGIGLAVGYAAYVLALSLGSGTTMAVIIGFVFFLVGFLLYNKILTVITAVAGGFLLYDALGFYLDPPIAGVIAIIVVLVGIWSDTRRH
jgi:hypothetical protein